ncbi:hypothetical protein [Sphingomonas sp. PR090111-T3T-6A]|uniref:hypothetical protein n=1 Tax=Sphingomonas sp. PR090111-T3T-6A TaxID=685778 RepID=UPI00036E313D|nr:hypothetical protein [Sphingomonas sp. PR090111-T3T-6A]
MRGLQQQSAHPGARIAEALLTSAGLGVILIAARTDRHWLDRHVLPHMFLSQGQQLLWWRVERIGALLLGVALILIARPWAASRIRRGFGRELAIRSILVLIAILLSGLACEAALRTAAWQGIDRWAATEEPRRVADARLGWDNMPGRVGIDPFNGQRIAYAVDADGRRIAAPDRRLDPARPTILFTGESIMLGFRLNWDETLAGRIEAATGFQSANLAVNGYGSDQSYLKLARELPRFQQPRAVVALFAPTLMERNLDEDRPHLDAALRWHPAQHTWRLQRLAKNVVLYHATQRIDDGIAMTRAVLEATVRAARMRGAAALILVPGFGPELPAERAITHRVLDEAGIPYVRVRIDPAWRIADDGHPDARADLAMARAVMAGLAEQRPDLFRR